LTAVPSIPYWIPNEKAQQLRYNDRRLTDEPVSREDTVARPPSSVGRAHPWQEKSWGYSPRPVTSHQDRQAWVELKQPAGVRVVLVAVKAQLPRHLELSTPDAWS
jgi:hypothetical protein